MESLKNMKNRNHLYNRRYQVEDCCTGEKKLGRIMDVEYTWIKAHAGHYGNELADKLAKEAARNNGTCYNKISKSEIEHQRKREKHRKAATTMG